MKNKKNRKYKNTVKIQCAQKGTTTKKKKMCAQHMDDTLALRKGLQQRNMKNGTQKNAQLLEKGPMVRKRKNMKNDGYGQKKRPI
jgi:hypothetical protein